MYTEAERVPSIKQPSYELEIYNLKLIVIVKLNQNPSVLVVWHTGVHFLGQKRVPVHKATHYLGSDSI